MACSDLCVQDEGAVYRAETGKKIAAFGSVLL
jgi:hypothetical protein